MWLLLLTGSEAPAGGEIQFITIVVLCKDPVIITPPFSRFDLKDVDMDVKHYIIILFLHKIVLWVLIRRKGTFIEYPHVFMVKLKKISGYHLNLEHKTHS